jgi:hypothetical protein
MIKGEIFIMTKGEYSDFGIHGTYRVRADFSWRDQVGVSRNRDENCYQLENRLVADGFLEMIEILTIHADDYGTLIPGAEEDARKK